MIRIPVKVKISPPKEKRVECLCPVMCLGCGTDTSLRSYDSTVYKKKPPLTLSGAMKITRAKGNFKICQSCRQRVENDYSSKIKQRRILRIVAILVGLALVPLAIIVQMIIFPSFPIMAPVSYSYLMIYWGVALSLIILFFGFAGAINGSKKELEDRIQDYPFRAFIDVTIGGDIIGVANKAFASGMADSMFIATFIMVAAAAFTFLVLPSDIRCIEEECVEEEEMVEAGLPEMVPATGD